MRAKNLVKSAVNIHKAKYLNFLLSKLIFGLTLFIFAAQTLSAAEIDSIKQERVPRFRYLDPIEAGFQPLYFKYQPEILSSDTAKSELKKQPDYRNPFADSRFANLEKRGTIYRGFTVGSDKDFAINSGLNLFLEGELYKNLKLKAVLNDKNMPISNTGSTALVEEIDNIYIQIEHPNFTSRMGDYQLERKDAGIYGNFNKKLSGVYLAGRILPHQAETAISSARNQFQTVTILPKSKKQGPYRLFDNSAFNAVNLIGGSEKVYYNGTLLKAGYDNDYYLDYESGELFFTAKIAVNDDDRISVDFEYNDNDYKKNIYFASNSGSFGKAAKGDDNFFSWQSAWYSGSDDNKKPLGFELTEANRQLLSNASADTRQITISGEKFVGEGKGSYQKITDSLSLTLPVYYKFAGSGKGDYEVVFTKVSAGGKYNRFYEDSTGTAYYDTVSTGGQYAPVKSIKTPEKHQFAQLIGQYTNNWLSVEQETVISKHFNNSLAKDLSDRFNGLADREKIILKSPELKWNSQEIGRFNLSVERNYKNSRLVTPGRSSKPNSGYALGLNVNPDTLTQTSFNSNLNYSYRNLYSTDIRYLTEKFANSLSSDFTEISGSGTNSLLHNFNYLAAIRKTDDLPKAQYFKRENWSGDFTVKLFDYYYLTPQTAIEVEKLTQADSLSGKENNFFSFKTRYYDPEKLEISNLTGYQLQDRIKNSRFEPYLERRSNLFTTDYRWGTVLKSTLLWNRQENYYLQADSQNQKYDLAGTKQFFNWRDKVRGSLEYEAGKTEENKKIRSYYKVTEGYGGYKLINGQFVPDEYGEYASYIINSENYFPVTSVKLYGELSLDPEEESTNDNISYWLSRFDFDGRWRLEEKSRWPNPEEIILLNLSHFRSDSTLNGLFEADQTLYFLQNQRFNLEYRYYYSDRLNNSYLKNGEIENQVKHTIGSRQRWKNGFITRLSAEYGTSDISYLNSSFLARNIVTQTLKSSISYELNREWRTTLALRYRKDTDNKKDEISHLFEISPGIEVQFLEKGRIFADCNYYLVKADALLPLQMADGYKEGGNWKWQLNSSYNITDKVSSSLNYNGRKLIVDEQAIHELSMEIRMSF